MVKRDVAGWRRLLLLTGRLTLLLQWQEQVNIKSREHFCVIYISTIRLRRRQAKPKPTIMKVVRFDFKQTRSHRLASDKFAFVSSVWHSLETVCKTTNLGLTLQLTNNYFHPRQDANLHNICLTNPINLA